MTQDTVGNLKVNNEIDEWNPCDWSAIERKLRDENFNVKHLFRDTRSRSGLDYGYVVSISEKNGKIYLHVISANYNSTPDDIFLDENDSRFIDGSKYVNSFADFIICESIEDAQEKIEDMVRILFSAYLLNEGGHGEDKHIKKNEIDNFFEKLSIDIETNNNESNKNISNNLLFDFNVEFVEETKHYSSKFPKIFENLEIAYFRLLSACWCSFVKHEEVDGMILKRLTEIKYVPDYSNNYDTILAINQGS